MLGDGEEASSVKAECSGEEKSVLVSVMMTPVSDAAVKSFTIQALRRR